MLPNRQIFFGLESRCEFLGLDRSNLLNIYEVQSPKERVLDQTCSSGIYGPTDQPYPTTRNMESAESTFRFL